MVSGSLYSAVRVVLVDVPVFVAQQLFCLSKTDENFMGNCVRLLTENCVENISRAGVKIYIFLNLGLTSKF